MTLLLDVISLVHVLPGGHQYILADVKGNCKEEENIVRDYSNCTGLIHTN